MTGFLTLFPGPEKGRRSPRTRARDCSPTRVRPCRLLTSRAPLFVTTYGSRSCLKSTRTTGTPGTDGPLSWVGALARWSLRACRAPRRAAVDVRHATQAYEGSGRRGVGKVWTECELACFLSPLMVDVAVLVQFPRGFLSLWSCSDKFLQSWDRISVKVPQIRFIDFPVVNRDRYVPLTRLLMCPWSCRGRFRLLSGCLRRPWKNSTYFLCVRARAIRTWTLNNF